MSRVQKCPNNVIVLLYFQYFWGNDSYELKRILKITVFVFILIYMQELYCFYHFYSSIESSSEMADFDRVCVYVDSHFKAVDSFTVSDMTVPVSDKMISLGSLVI